MTDKQHCTCRLYRANHVRATYLTDGLRNMWGQSSSAVEVTLLLLGSDEDFKEPSEFFETEDGSSKLLRNISNYLPIDGASCFIRLLSPHQHCCDNLQARRF
jgi:hypothetical protein